MSRYEILLRSPYKSGQQKDNKRVDTKNIEVYVINLDGSNTRLSDTQQQLDNAGIEFTRISAVDGRGKTLADFPEYDDKAAQKIMGRSLIPTEIGCYLSHVKCVEAFLRTDAEYLMVFEDDFNAVSGIKSILSDTLDYLEATPEIDWHLINFSATKRKVYTPVTTIRQHTLSKTFYFPISAFGLIWSRKGANEFMRHTLPIRMPVDNLFQSWLSQTGKGLTIWPPLVEHTGLVSEIANSKAKQNRHALYFLRKQKRLLRDKLYALKNKLVGA